MKGWKQTSEFGSHSLFFGNYSEVRKDRITHKVEAFNREYMKTFTRKTAGALEALEEGLMRDPVPLLNRIKIFHEDSADELLYNKEMKTAWPAFQRHDRHTVECTDFRYGTLASVVTCALPVPTNAKVLQADLGCMPATLALGKALCGLHEDPFSREQAEKQQGQNCSLIPAPCEAAPAGPALRNLEEQILTHKGCYKKNFVPYNSRTKTAPLSAWKPVHRGPVHVPQTTGSKILN
ncbi:hypothetical protein U0070_011370 [Myodes glareolus]|uniref:Uncharacterized protein n=1 Tax=Myodes glareolus TaxID=447135 RepID=A0AAW0HYD1_MYOGA